MKGRYYITTAIAYPNGAPHIGHAYEAIATDAIARFQRLDGYDVLFLTGTDEHGIKMLQTAQREGLTPAELVARNVPRFQAMVERFEVSNDDFIRTTEPPPQGCVLPGSVGEAWRRLGRHLSRRNMPAGTRCATKAFYAEDEIDGRVQDGKRRVGPPVNNEVEWVERSRPTSSGSPKWTGPAAGVLREETATSVAAGERGATRLSAS